MKITLELFDVTGCSPSTTTNVEGLRELKKSESEAVRRALEYLLERITSKSALSL